MALSQFGPGLQTTIAYEVALTLRAVLAAAPDVARNLVEIRFPVPESFEAPVVLYLEPDKPPSLGLLGVLNGLFTRCRVTGVYDDSGKLVDFDVRPHSDPDGGT